MSTHIERAINEHNKIESTIEHLKKDLADEIKNFDIEKCEPAQRGARITAMIKRCKTYYMLEYVLRGCKKRGDMDMVLTPVMVRRLCKGLFRRSCSQAVLVKLFGGRMTTKATSKQHSIVNGFIDEWRDDATAYWARVEGEIKGCIVTYRDNVKKAERARGKASLLGVNANIRIR